jgi:hypothetical protein
MACSDQYQAPYVNRHRVIAGALVVLLVAPILVVRPPATGDAAPFSLMSGSPPAVSPDANLRLAPKKASGGNKSAKKAREDRKRESKAKSSPRKHSHDERKNNKGQRTGKQHAGKGNDDRKRGGSNGKKHDANRDKRHRAGKHRKPAKRQRERGQQQEACERAGSTWLPKVGLCTHGPDPAPPGVDITQRAPPLPASRARVAAEAIVCDGDGQSGSRVQVLYARAADVHSHYDAYLPSFRAWGSNVDAIVRGSAAEAGGGSRRVRFVTTPGCDIDVPEVVLSPSGDDTFQATITQLKSRGFDRTDRKYLVFVDTTSAGICGIGNQFIDDRPQQSNPNNSGPMFARVDAGCWSASHVPAHELFHTLGAVQNSAPNTSGFGHCIDEYDVMCYEDVPTTVLRIDCPDPADDDRLDCGHDDYFHPAPVEGSYLATHWNTADNQFLIGADPEPADTELPTLNWTSPVGNFQTHSTPGGAVALEVTASDNTEVSYVDFSWYDLGRSKRISIRADATAPYTATLNVGDLPPGNTPVFAAAYDPAGNTTEKNIWISKEGSNPPDPTPEPPDYLTLTITSPAGGAMLTAGVPVDVEVAVVNGSDETTVEVRSCPGNSCSWPGATSLGSDASAPYAVSWQPQSPGTFTLLARANDADKTMSDPVTVSVGIAATPTPTATETPQPTSTPTPQPTATPSPEPTSTPIPTPTFTPTPEPTSTPTPEPTSTPTPEPTSTPTPVPTITPEPTATFTPTPEPSATPTPEPSATPTPEATATPTPEPTETPTPVPTVTPQPTDTPSPIPQPTATPESTATPTPEPTPDPAPPTVAITAPRGGAKLKPRARITLVAAVAGGSGQAAVEFRMCPGVVCSWGGAEPLGSDSSAPYEMAWQAPKSGTVTFLAQAAADQTATSDPVTVKIKKKKKKGK